MVLLQTDKYDQNEKIWMENIRPEQMWLKCARLSRGFYEMESEKMSQAHAVLYPRLLSGHVYSTFVWPDPPHACDHGSQPFRMFTAWSFVLQTGWFSKQMWKNRYASCSSITPSPQSCCCHGYRSSHIRHLKQHRVWSDPSQKTSVIVVAPKQTLIRCARNDHKQIPHDWTFKHSFTLWKMANGTTIIMEATSKCFDG